MALKDRTNLDTYGQVIDQNGNPVAGVKIKGEAKQAWEYKTYYTETDARGLFSFVDIHGRSFFIHPQKEGYGYNQKQLPERPQDYLADPALPLRITMYKLKGAEPMIHNDTKGLPYWYAFLQPNGDPARINMRTCRDDKYIGERQVTGERHYDLTIALHLDEPIKTNGNRWLVCNWSATVGITNGGLVELPANTLYPFEAPADGYQPSLTFNFPTKMAGWTDHFEKSFYFKSDQGKTYGRMTMQMNNWGRLALEIYANPAGSRNLEFDSKKQIMR